MPICACHGEKSQTKVPKRKQLEIPELKTTRDEIKNPVNKSKLISRLDTAEDRNCDLESNRKKLTRLKGENKDKIRKGEDKSRKQWESLAYT